MEGKNCTEKGSEKKMKEFFFSSRSLNVESETGLPYIVLNSWGKKSIIGMKMGVNLKFPLCRDRTIKYCSTSEATGKYSNEITGMETRSF